MVLVRLSAVKMFVEGKSIWRTESLKRLSVPFRDLRHFQVAGRSLQAGRQSLKNNGIPVSTENSL
jgi:hypothetical protein